ncbi:MAG: ATP-binding protein, partial [Kofleriaceae bacterium]
RATVASVSAARWLVGVLACVVLCFLAATAVGEYMESTIAGRANLIIGNAMPSVQMLTTARGNLRQLELALERYATIPSDQRPELRDRIAATRQDIGAALSSYVALPFFADEPELYAHVQEGIAGLDAQLKDVLSQPAPAGVDHIHHAFGIVDEAILRVVSFDAAQGRRLGREIQQVRGETRSIVVLLDAVSVALAIGAALLALRQLRRTTRAQAAEREARDRHETELAAQNEALGEFAGRVAHDVLSPLSTTMFALELLRRTCEDDPAACRMADRGAAAVTRVHVLVDGLLAFSRAGGQPEPGVSTEIAPVIADVVDGLSGQAKERRIELMVSSIPAGSVACSSGILTSMVSNLVRNAIKYMGEAPERRIDVRVVDGHDRWRFEVEDTGPGIPLEHQQRIFQPYVQLGRRAEGIGLGLATVDRLVRAHGGSLGLSSPPDHGCLFWFELPKAISTQPGAVRNVASLEHQPTS